MDEQSTEGHDRGRGPVRRGTARIVGGFVVLYLAIGALSPYLPVYYASLGIGLESIGLLAALYAAAAMLGAPLWGATADRFGSTRPILAIAGACAALAAAGLGVAAGTVAIAIAAMILALSMSGIMPILDASAIELAGAGSTSYARMRVWGSASFIAGVLLTGWVTERAGPGAMFAVLVPVLMVMALVGMGIRSRPTVPPLSRLTAISSVLRQRGLAWFLAVVLVTWTSATTINAFYSIHLVDVGAPQSLVGVSWALGAAVEVPIMIGFPWLMRRVGLKWLLLTGSVLFVMRAAILALTRDPMIVAATMVLHGGAFALFLVGGVLHVSRLAPAGAAATAQGLLVAIVFGLAQIVGPSLGGLVAEGSGLQTAFTVAGIGSVIATGSLLVALRR